MPVQVFPSVAVIVLGISAIGAGTWLVDKYIDPRVRFFFNVSPLFFFARISIARFLRDDPSLSLLLPTKTHTQQISLTLSALNPLSNPYNHQNKNKLHLKSKTADSLEL